MTADAGLDPDRNRGDADRTRAPRSAAMQAYCATLSRFTSSVQSTELMLRHEEATSADDADQVDHATTSRLRGIDRARAEAQSGLEHTDTVRNTHGITGTDVAAPAERRARRPSGTTGDLGIALTSLARRRDELRAAEAEFEDWLHSHDRNAQQVVLGTAAAAGVLGALVMVAVGTSSSATWALSLLIAGTAAVTVAGLAAGVLVRLPVMCTGPSLVREPHAAAVTRFAAALTGTAAAGLIAVGVVSGAL